MRVLLVGWHDNDRETHAAEGWLARHGFVARRADLRTAGAGDIDWCDVVWCHGTEPLIHAPSPQLNRRLFEDGAALLTLGACSLPAQCGFEPMAPLESRGVWHDDDDPLWDSGFRDWPDFPHIRGFQGWARGTHPLFEGFQRGTFTRELADGDSFDERGYLWPQWPDSARVIAVERAYVRLHAHRALAWEYSIRDRRLLCIGAHVVLDNQNPPLRAQRDRLLGNAIGVVARRSSSAATEAHWPNRRRLLSDGNVPMIAAPSLPASTLREGDAAVVDPEDAPFTLAGRRILVTGNERAGLQDVWIHPLGVISHGVQLLLNDLAPEPVRVQIAPHEIRRTLRGAAGTVTEQIVPALRSAALLLSYERPDDTSLEVTFKVPLRLQWPFDPDALLPLTSGHTERAARKHEVSIAGAGAQHIVHFTVDGADEVWCDDDSSAPTVRIRSERAGSLRILLVAGADGAEALREYAASIPADIVAERQNHFASLRKRTIRSRTPNDNLDAGVHWAVHRLEMFLAQAPDGDTGLMAGYATSGEGWSVSRPGYAWFFGRDACWSADAMLAAGMFEEVREVLHHLASTRDITGKVIHELTTSGVAHYDAADSTPLFLRLVCAYFEWTADTATIRDVWDAVRDGLNFVATTDRDGDGLPENRGVGHGWIESGPLGGGDVTSYVAAVWIDALRRLQHVAAAVDDTGVAAACQGMLARATHSFQTRLRDPATGRVILQLQRDGSPQTDLTALNAVPIALGVDRDKTADSLLDVLTSPSYATSWGIRLLSSGDGRYDPRGYHNGAVWPLFTGWTSLACFERCRSADGVRLLLANASLWTKRAKGAFDEVLDGDTEVARGVCPDQAWSAAMVIAPLVHGVWGVQPNASAKVLRLGLQIPAEWDKAALDGVRVGEATINLRFERESARRTERVSFMVSDALGSVDTVIVEVLGAADEMVELSVARGSSSGRTVREARPGWNWYGVSVEVGTGEGRVDVHRQMKS